MDQLEAKFAQMEKYTSDINFVLSLMIKHKATKVPEDERNKITDPDIFSLCELSRSSLSKLLVTTKKSLIAIATRQATSSGKFIFVLKQRFIV